MKTELVFFTQEQGSLFVRLLLSHLLADFVFQTNSILANKKWFSKQMLLHIGIVFIVSFLLSFSLKIALSIAFIHWIIDSMKCSLQGKISGKETYLFFGDQLVHLLSVLFIWVAFEGIWVHLLNAVVKVTMSYSISLLLLGYVLVTWPLAYAMKFVLKGIDKTTQGTSNKKIEQGGKLIGIFERIIILSFVYLNKYEAIGFLITGKSIIRFAQKEEGLRSEYVLVGTMISYAFSIVVGMLINWLLSLT